MKNFKNVLVVDVESTCWKDGNQAPDGTWKSEILETGFVLVNIVPNYNVVFENNSFVEKQSEKFPFKQILGKPETIYSYPTNSEISVFATSLHGIDDEVLEENDAVSFAEACKKLEKFRYRNDVQVWASWGRYDFRQFERQCANEGLRFPLPYQHLNIKALYAAKYGALMSVAEACNLVGIEFEGRPHSGQDDAWNIARLLKAII